VLDVDEVVDEVVFVAETDDCRNSHHMTHLLYPAVLRWPTSFPPVLTNVLFNYDHSKIQFIDVSREALPSADLTLINVPTILKVRDMETTTSKSASSKGDANMNEPHCFTDTHGVITTTMNDLPGYRIVRVIGAIYGLSVRSRNWGADLASVFKSAVGGELKYLTNMLYTGRDHAVDRLVGECMSRGGNAVIAMRFGDSEIMNFAQVTAYGTACVVEKIESSENSSK
jgi:uncharacterized protein YbjQ (UPF0145 family)